MPVLKPNIISVIFVFVCIIFNPQAAQAQTSQVTNYDASWTTIINGQASEEFGFSTPEDACEAQRLSFNPKAEPLPGRYSSKHYYYCNWRSAQDGDPDATTVLPGFVVYRCHHNSGTLVDYQCLSAAELGHTNCLPCDPKQPMNGAPRPMVGNPISVANGSKVQEEIDYATADGQFEIKRQYDSRGNRGVTSAVGEMPGFGPNWHGVVPSRLVVSSSDVYWRGVTYHGEDGSHFKFYSDYNMANYSYEAGTEGRMKLTFLETYGQTRDVFFTSSAIENGVAEARIDVGNGDYTLYRRAGIGGPSTNSRQFVPIEHGFANGYKQFYEYDGADIWPKRVSDNFGRSADIEWDAVHNVNSYVVQSGGAGSGNTLAPSNDNFTDHVIRKISLPDGSSLNYDYDAPAWLGKNGAGGLNMPITGRKNRLKTVKRNNSTGQTIWSRSYIYGSTYKLAYSLTGIVNTNGQQISTYNYDENTGLIISSEKAGGYNKYNVSHTVDADGYTYREVTNPLGRKEIYKFAGNPTGAPTPRKLLRIDGQATGNVEADTRQYSYQGASVTDYTNQRSIMTKWTMDNKVRPTYINEADGTITNRGAGITWDQVKDLPIKIEVGNLRTEYEYDAQRRVTKQTLTDIGTQLVPYATNGQSRITAFSWADNGRLLAINGPRLPDAQGRDDITSFSYDPLGNLTSMTNALGHTIAYSAYDANGRPGKMTDANGIVTQFSYDTLGRLISVKALHPTSASNDTEMLFDYDGEGQITGITQPGIEKLVITYNLAGLLTSVSNVSGERIEYIYDPMGNVKSETVKTANGTTVRSIQRTFDDIGRMLTLTLGPNRTHSFQYDKNGNVTKRVSARNFDTNYAFDALDRVTSEIAPDAGVRATSYSKLDDLEVHTDANNVTTNFVYNAFGDVIQEVSPDRGTSTYHYDAAGQLAASVDGRGQRVDYEYDVLGRLTKKTPVGRTAEAVTYIYDTLEAPGAYPKGHLTRILNAQETIRYVHDWRGKIWRVIRPLPNGSLANTFYAFNKVGQITQMNYPSGRIVFYNRDSKGRIQSVATREHATATTQNLMTNMTYQAFGNLSGGTYGNGTVQLNQWTNDSRLARKRFTNASGVKLWSKTYGYDGDDNIWYIFDELDSSKSYYFAYDSVGRLIRTTKFVDGPYGERVDYKFDKNGNRTGVERRAVASQTTPDTTESYTYTAGTNRLSAIAAASGTRSITHDARGNLVSETRPGNVNVTAQYDAYGRLTLYEQSGVARVENVYNGRDDRVKETKTLANGTPSTRRFIYDLTGRLLGEYGTGVDDVYAEHIWLNPDPANDNASPYGGDDAIGGYAPLAIAVGTGSGSSTSLAWVASDHLGVPVMLLDGTGTPTAAPSTITLHAFPGQMKTLPDLYYNRYRDYDPTTGRYIQADPIGLAGDVNPYLYALGNPVGYADPLGLTCLILFSSPKMIEGANRACDATGDRNNPRVLHIFAHGNPIQICDESGCAGAAAFLRDYAEFFKKAERVHLWACETGYFSHAGIGFELANLLGKPVTAPIKRTWWDETGYLGTAERYPSVKEFIRDIFNEGHHDRHYPNGPPVHSGPPKPFNPKSGEDWRTYPGH